MTGAELSSFFQQQLQQWPEAATRFAQLKSAVEIRQLCTDGIGLSVQWNPARIVSTKAPVGDATKPIVRPCFLCSENQVAEQFGLPYEGETRILVNPFPILPGHLVVAKTTHEPQTLGTLAKSLYQLATEVPEYVFFYNGARSGASAPDHAHYQGGLRGTLPLERDYAKIAPQLNLLDVDSRGVELLRYVAYPCPLYIVRNAVGEAEAHYAFVDRFLHTLPKEEGRSEADFNLFVWQEAEVLITAIIPRSKHRPICFFADGDEQCLVSPGAIDMAGLLITPREEDFRSMTAERMTKIQAEVGGFLTIDFQEEPVVRVGVLRGEEISVEFLTPYSCDGVIYEGKHTFRFEDSAVAWQEKHWPYLDFKSQHSAGRFIIHDVIIGVNFHWEQQENQTFEGDLSILIEGQGLTAVNKIHTEVYLSSVISSEMSADAPLEFLKAHTVISRSWLFRQLLRKQCWMKQQRMQISEAERMVWYDNDNHLYYDICADDHCQRYQGIKHQNKETILQAIRATKGEVLWYDGAVCDARFYKCCGGMTELFSTCWEDEDFDYLPVIADKKVATDINDATDLCTEDAVKAWIENGADDFCNTTDKALLSEVLNGFDQATNDFYRWTMEVSQEELQRFLQEKAQIDLGDIVALQPLERGRGGRIKRLRFVGTKGTMIVGKELEIRRLLSSSHLYSSAFIVEPIGEKGKVPTHFLLQGAGWGHGVGLCQIGAAVMAKEEYTYQEILAHYYRGASLRRLYAHQL